MGSGWSRNPRHPDSRRFGFACLHRTGTTGLEGVLACPRSPWLLGFVTTGVTMTDPGSLGLMARRGRELLKGVDHRR